MADTIIICPLEQNPDSQYIERLSNHLFDYVMPTLSPTAWMVLCFIVRKTTGWRKESDRLSMGDIKKGTGIKSDNTVIKAIAELEERQFILSEHRKDTRQKNTYTLNTTIKIEVVTTSKNKVDDKTISKNEVPTTSKNEVVDPLTTSKNEDSKEQYLKDNRKEHVPDYLGDVFDKQGQPVTPTGHAPVDQHFNYRDEFLKIYQEMTGEYPDRVKKDEIIRVAQDGNVTPECWREGWRTSKLNWTGMGKNPPIARVVEVCEVAGGDYEKFKQWKWPDTATNGRDSPAGLPQGKVTLPAMKNKDGSIN